MIFRLAVVALMAAAVAGIVAMRVRDSGGKGPEATASPSGALPPFGRGPVPAGLHVFAEFEPALSMVFGNGWNSVVPPDSDEIALDGPVFLAIARPSMVVDDETGEFVPMPNDLIAWVGTHQKFDAEAPVATTLGGEPAFSIDATAKEGIKTLAFSTAEAILVAKGDRMRLIVADVHGTTVAATMIASPAEFDTAIAKGEALLDTLRFESSPSPTTTST